MTVVLHRFSITACIGILLAAFAFAVILVTPAPVAAQALDCTNEENATKIGCVDGAVAECLDENGDVMSSSRCDLTRNYINPIIALLSIIVGLAVTVGIILGGITISTAGGDPNKLAAGKQKIFTSVVALIFFGLLWAFLNWILPGGLGA